jgi:hypothetical protein
LRGRGVICRFMKKIEVMNNELRSRALVCIDLLSKSLSGQLNDRINNRDQKDLSAILWDMTMYLPEFNFYPSEEKSKCCEVAFFTSLVGKRWNLDKKQRLSLDEMFKILIRHCQGSCANITKYVAIIADNWDDDVVEFWRSNLNQLKNHGVTIELHMLLNGTIIKNIL